MFYCFGKSKSNKKENSQKDKNKIEIENINEKINE
jgi:hypothetical protein